MPIPRGNNSNSNNVSIKTILALSHTIIIRFFQFRKIMIDETDNNNNNNNNEIKENKLNEDDRSSDDNNVIALICNEIFSIPYYFERLQLYSLDQTILKSLTTDYIWKQIIFEFNKNIDNIYNSFLFYNNNNKIIKIIKVKHINYGTKLRHLM